MSELRDRIAAVIERHACQDGDGTGFFICCANWENENSGFLEGKEHEWAIHVADVLVNELGLSDE